jgi:hypothetical protein
MKVECEEILYIIKARQLILVPYPLTVILLMRTLVVLAQ